MSSTVMDDVAEAGTGVESQAKAALSNSPIYPLHDLEVVRLGKRLVILGRLKSYYQKQLAQEVVRKFACGLQVVNEVKIA